MEKSSDQRKKTVGKGAKPVSRRVKTASKGTKTVSRGYKHCMQEQKGKTPYAGKNLAGTKHMKKQSCMKDQSI